MYSLPKSAQSCFPEGFTDWGDVVTSLKSQDLTSKAIAELEAVGEDLKDILDWMKLDGDE
ncbi:hypothetical protein NG796_06185 [Laspinema sp. A4]|uniref:hypothetical protein n=1 Tax=Laspinema sp. D2d TaxID=2953686 RepID=UPI0021BAF8EC|nr:hypothetical protein [Laspinema sp. D2d]MCT7982877.1 hypothetical protein [Laspinema sp. D2d]